MNPVYDYRKYAVLYVDDEEQALKYFKKAMDKDFVVLTATNVADANAIVDKEAHRIGVVITDQRMPGALGVELLKRLKQKWPGIVRLLITAYSEIDSAIEAVNSGAIFRYITKPADLKELKETLKRAMEIFLNSCERETLLRERLAVIQRMIVADRVRSLAAMAGGISHHLRNSMTALTCYLEETAPKSAGGAVATDPQFAEQLWTLAHKERDHLLTIIQRVGQTVGEQRKTFDNELAGDELIKRAVLAATSVSGRNIETQADPAAPKLKLDADAATIALKTLINYVARLSQPADKLVIAASPTTIGQNSATMIRVNAGSRPWTEQDVAAFFTPFAFPATDPSDLGVELLGAFSVAYQHGGDIIVNRAAPLGPGFDLLLPADPAQVQRPDLQEGLLEKLFTHFETAANTPPGQPMPKAA
jgi:two-component system probable response regulator PhcQ